MSKTAPQRPTSQTIPSKGSLGVKIAAAAVAATVLSAPSYADSELDALKKEVEALKQEVSKSKKKASPVSIYGILDTGIEHLTNVGANGDSVTRVPPITGTLASRIGFKLDKEIKPGLNVIGTMEAGFNLDDGNSLQGGRIFGRQLYVGLKTSAGSFTIGRQWSMLTGAMARASDQLGPNIYAMGSLDTYLPNSRFDNSIAWKNKYGPLSLGVSYSLGRDTTGGAPAHGTCAGEQSAANSTSECRGMSAMVRYDQPKYGLAFGYDQMKGGDGATVFFFNGQPPFAFTDSGDTDTRTVLGGYVKFGATQVGLGVLNRDVETQAQDVSHDIVYASVSHKLSDTIKLDGGVQKITNDDQNTEATLTAVRGFYNFGKGLSAYAQVGYLSNDDTSRYQLSAGPGVAPATGENQTGYMVGIRYIYR